MPSEALREIIINAVIHRDLSDPSSYVAIAVFDDRIEVRSVGDLPFGISAEQLSGDHPSKPRNPDVASAFHRTGAIEVWGRGTNRVIDACRAWGIGAPTFKVDMGVTTVTFRAEIVPGVERQGPSWDQAEAKLGAGSSPRNRVGTSFSIGTHGPLGTHKQDEVPGPSLGSSASGGTAGDDDP